MTTKPTFSKRGLLKVLKDMKLLSKDGGSKASRTGVKKKTKSTKGRCEIGELPLKIIINGNVHFANQIKVVVHEGHRIDLITEKDEGDFYQTQLTSFACAGSITIKSTLNPHTPMKKGICLNELIGYKKAFFKEDGSPSPMERYNWGTDE